METEPLKTSYPAPECCIKPARLISSVNDSKDQLTLIFQCQCCGRIIFDYYQYPTEEDLKEEELKKVKK